jgi:hypothetical protein
LLEKKHPLPWFTQFEYLFHYSTLWVLKESIRNKNVIYTTSTFAKLGVISNLFSFLYTPCIGKYNKHTCREVSPRGEFGKLPATRGASNSGLTEPASMFGFYTIHIVALFDKIIDVLSTFSGPKNHWALNTSLSTSRLPLLHALFGFLHSQ